MARLRIVHLPDQRGVDGDDAVPFIERGVEVIPWQTYGDPAPFDYIGSGGGLMAAFGARRPARLRGLAPEVTPATPVAARRGPDRTAP